MIQINASSCFFNWILVAERLRNKLNNDVKRGTIPNIGKKLLRKALN